MASGPVSRSLDRKRVLITGASQGLGFAIAREMRRAGAGLLLVARSPENLEKARAELTAGCSSRRPVFTFAADLAEPTAASRIVEHAGAIWKGFDVLVNNAAILGPIGPVWENEWEEWTRTIQVNLLSPVAICRLALPLLADGGVILNISGGGAAAPRPRFTAYSTAKAGLVRFSETLAEETRERRIRVNCVAPGAMNTQMLEAILKAGPGSCGNGEYALARKQSEQGGTPPEIPAQLCVFLASDEASAISGKLLSAVWDPWKRLCERVEDLRSSDIYTLRRIVPGDRGKSWD